MINRRVRENSKAAGVRGVSAVDEKCRRTMKEWIYAKDKF